MLQVLPFSAGAYRGGPFPFLIYRFPKPSAMEVVTLENHMGLSYLETPGGIKYYGDAFDRLCTMALGPLPSQSLIRDLAGQLDS